MAQYVLRKMGSQVTLNTWDGVKEDAVLYYKEIISSRSIDLWRLLSEINGYEAELEKGEQFALAIILEL